MGPSRGTFSLPERLVERGKVRLHGRAGLARHRARERHRGPRRRPHLMDFGLAREIGGDKERLTVTGALVGTPAYMAPEQADGSAQKQGPHTDVYALGAVLYRALAGRPPFDADTFGIASHQLKRPAL
ncbi:hypothetical protein HY251_15785 [bacterium]|nr:hypothetical protein [bacterium]